MVWGSIISAVGSLAGSALGSRSSESEKDASREMHGENMAMQREFAQQGIRWRVEDAKAAGIHPLYALGAQLPSYSPSTYIPGGDNGAGALLAQAGQDIGRAVDATRTPKERTTARLEALSVDRAELENELLRSKIAREKAALNPPLPDGTARQLIPGQGDIERMGLTVTGPTSHVEIKPQEVTPANPRRNFQEPSPVTDLGFAWTGSGYAPVPSKDVKDRMEDITIPQLMWGWRNNVLPNVPGQGKPPPVDLLPEGSNNWRWSYSKQEWQPYFDPHRARVPVERLNRHGHHGPDRP